MYQSYKGDHSDFALSSVQATLLAYDLVTNGIKSLCPSIFLACREREATLMQCLSGKCSPSKMAHYSICPFPPLPNSLNLWLYKLLFPHHHLKMCDMQHGQTQCAAMYCNVVMVCMNTWVCTSRHWLSAHADLEWSSSLGR